VTVTPVVPPAGTNLDDKAAKQLAGELDAWSAEMASQLVDLEAQAQVNGDDAVRADVAVAFGLWRAVSQRIETWSASAGGGSSRRAELLAAAWTPLTADTGEVVAQNLADAITFLSALVAKLAGGLAANQEAAAAASSSWMTLDDDLRHASRAAARLGQEVRHVAELETEARGRSRTAPPPDDLVRRASEVRARIDAAEAEREDVRRRLDGAVAMLAELDRREAEVRTLADACRQKIANAPRLAVPSVAAIGAPPDGSTDGSDGRPWPAVRAEAVAWLQLADRTRRALDEAARRFEAPLARRDELRGLLQAFRGKAASAGLAEHEALDPRYNEARDTLWSAPCDVGRAEALVDEYVRRINTMMHGVN